jgi:hypothetical protein
VQQLVIQFPLKALNPDRSEFGAVIAIEERLERLSKGAYDVDGHDAGMGEMNIFIITESAVATFEAIKDHLPGERSWRAGFRDLDSDDYSPLAPTGLATFEVH